MENQPPTKTLPSAPTSQPTTQHSERKQIAAILARMALHYWRPDFTPEQARMIIEDYLDDLRGYTPAQVEAACVRYRKEPDSRFFPHTGELLKLLGARSSFAEPEYRLPTWTTPKALLERPRGKLKTVAEVLRENGAVAAAEKWEARNE